MNWQLIATAPKDNTLILGCSAGIDWDLEYSIPHCPQTIRFGAYRSNEPTATSEKQWRDKDGHPVFCTHWAPLPEAPKTLTELP